jgi:hypothetical protein
MAGPRRITPLIDEENEEGLLVIPSSIVWL